MRTKLAAAAVLGLLIFATSFMVGGSTYAFLSDKEKIGGQNDSIEVRAGACFDENDDYYSKLGLCLDKNGIFHGKITDIAFDDNRKFGILSQNERVNQEERKPALDVDDSAGRFHLWAKIPNYESNGNLDKKRFSLSLEGKKGSINQNSFPQCISSENKCKVYFNRSDLVELANATGSFELVLNWEWDDGTKYEARKNITIYDHDFGDRSSDEEEKGLGEERRNVENTSDGIPPRIHSFDAEQVNEKVINVTIESNESLKKIQVMAANGTNETALNRSVFKKQSTGDNHTYKATHAARNGSLNLTLTKAEDRAGNDGADNLSIRINLTSGINQTTVPLNLSNTTGKQSGNVTNESSEQNITVAYSVAIKSLVEGEDLTVKASAANNANSSLNTTLNLKMDGGVVDSRNLTVQPGLNTSTTFNKTLAPGNHTVTINDLNDTEVTVTPKLKALITTNQSVNVTDTVQANLESNLAPSSAVFKVTSDSGEVTNRNITSELQDLNTKLQWNSSEVQNGTYTLHVLVKKDAQTTQANTTVNVITKEENTTTSTGEETTETSSSTDDSNNTEP